VFFEHDPAIVAGVVSETGGKRMLTPSLEEAQA
jgi:hypothetical protein